MSGPSIDIAADFAAMTQPVSLAWTVQPAVSFMATADAFDGAAAAIRAKGRAALDDLGVQAARALYREMDRNPSRYRPANEALRRAVLSGKLRAPDHPVVRANVALSLATGLCVGTYDAARVSREVVLRRGRADDTYLAIGGAPYDVADLPVLAGPDGPFGNASRDGAAAAIGPATETVLLVFYGLGLTRADLAARIANHPPGIARPVFEPDALTSCGA